jgi:hypothetical protein
MNTQIIELEARQLLEKEGRRSRAKALLDRRASITMTTLVSSIATGIALFCMADFTAPLAVKVMITLSFSSAIVSQVESWQSRRRLEAAIELLRQADSGRG